VQTLKSELAAIDQEESPSKGSAATALTEQLMALDGVEGVGRGAGDSVVVYLSKHGSEKAVSKLAGGQRIEFHYTGQIRAQ